MADSDSSERGDESDESLDVKSDKFNPLKALYSSKVRLALPDAPVYDNISKFESVLKGHGVKEKKDKLPVGETSKRRFLPHQEPVSGKRRSEWSLEQKNVLSKMQKTLGPLGMLYKCMESRNRIRVYTRNVHGIRGHVEAYVAAFDKHWNLALEDCYEVWSRRVKRKAPALGADAVKTEMAAQSDVLKKVVRKTEGKMETLERHVPQMLLRGEQVAIIVRIN